METQKRILLWGLPRTLSTAVTRAMVSRKNCKVLMEPSLKTFYLGEERGVRLEDQPGGIHEAWPQELPIPNCTWKDYYNEISAPFEGQEYICCFLPSQVLMEPSLKTFYLGEERALKLEDRASGIPEFWPQQLPIPNCSWKDYYNELNQPFEGYDEVFLKELSCRYRKFLDEGTMDTVIPKNYVHTFLIRDPAKTMPSLFRLLPHPTIEHIWDELELTYDWVTKVKGCSTFLMDADDLQTNPESVLRAYCEFLGIDYQDSMVNWPPVPPDQLEEFTRNGDFQKLARTADTFLPSTSENQVKPEVQEAMEEAVRRATPIYERLKAKKGVWNPKM